MLVDGDEFNHRARYLTSLAWHFFASHGFPAEIFKIAQSGGLTDVRRLDVLEICLPG
jgi:hypothetical protein